MMLSFVALVVTSIAWSLIGYSEAFGPGSFIGSMQYGAFDSGDRLREGTCISEHIYFLFQLAFAAVTIAVISGGVVQRITLHAFALFSVLWLLIVYCPLAHWIFYPQGWLASWGVLDFAGGLVVEMASGLSAFVLAFWIGPGRTLHGGSHGHAKPHSLPFMLLGAGTLLTGWLGFNAGSALAAGYVAGRAATNTHLAASSALAMWSVCEVVFGGDKWLNGRPTAFGAATGLVVGLVAITPACGFISQMASLLLGVLAVPLSYAATVILKRSGVDDRLECLACHGVAGAFGVLFTGLFANVNEGSPANGAFYGNGMQFVKQLAGVGVTAAMCAVGTTACYWGVWLVYRLLKLDLRVPDELQDHVDAAVHGEHGYHISRPVRGLSGLLGLDGSGFGSGRAPLLNRQDSEMSLGIPISVHEHAASAATASAASAQSGSGSAAISFAGKAGAPAHGFGPSLAGSLQAGSADGATASALGAGGAGPERMVSPGNTAHVASVMDELSDALTAAVYGTSAGNAGSAGSAGMALAPGLSADGSSSAGGSPSAAGSINGGQGSYRAPSRLGPEGLSLQMREVAPSARP